MALRDLRLPVAGQANDFREPRRLGEAIPGLWKGHGDVYFVREFSGGGGVVPVARLADPSSGRVMAISSTERCVQLYTGVSLDGTLTGKSGRRYGRHGGMCLECEGYPNGANAPALGDIVLRPGNTYRQTTVHTFSTDEAR
jgi:aldose 1-epimerase